MIKPAKKNNLYEEISKQIIQLISKGHWKSGERIPTELALSKEFEVSRNSIREAIKALELVGLLSSKTGIGTFVAEHAIANIQNMKLANLIESESSLIELMETRLIIEPGLAELATEKANDEDLEELYAIIKRAQEAFDTNTYTFNKGFLFHKHIIKIANNRVLEQFVNNITDNLIETRKAVFLKNYKTYIAESEVSEHLEIYEYIKNRDAKSAGNAMYEHILKALKILRDE